MELISALTYFASGFVILLTYIYLKFFRRDPHVVKYLDKFPGPPISFLFGNALEYAVQTHEFLTLNKQFFEKYKGTFRVWLGPQGRLMICDADIAGKILSSSIHIDRSSDYENFHSWLRTGLVTSNGQKWLTRRKLLTPAFHFKILDDFLDVFNEQSEIMVNILNKECSDGKSFDIFPYLTRCTLDIICETAMGTKISAQTERDSDYVRAVHIIGDFIMKRTLRPWLKQEILWKLFGYKKLEDELLKILHGFTSKVINERKAERNGAQMSVNRSVPAVDDDDTLMTKKKRSAFLDLLLDVADDGRVLSDTDICEETDTFMFAGHDTTAANLCWTIFNLASNPDCLKQVQEELDGIFGSDRTRDVTKADISQMKYLECCIKETLRIFPSVPIITRSINQDLGLDNGQVLPKGSVAAIIPFFIHRDPKYFPEPEIFKPDRFFPENSQGRNPYCYVPFAAGPRNCIGQKFALIEDKIVLAKLLLNFSFEACEKVEDIILSPDLILRPKGGIIVKLQKRIV